MCVKQYAHSWQSVARSNINDDDDSDDDDDDDDVLCVNEYGNRYIPGIVLGSLQMLTNVQPI